MTSLRSAVVAVLSVLATSARAEEGGTSVQSSPGLATGDWGERVELVIPPAARDTKPNLAVIQSHRTVDGEVGSGWRLDVTSVIRRRSTTNGVPTTSSTEPVMYVIDGTPLVAVTGPGTAHYQPEIYDGSRFDYDATTVTWTRKRDGWIWTYGGVVNSTRTLSNGGAIPFCQQAKDCNIESWFVSSVVDPFGNRIDYTYLAPSMPSTLTGKFPTIPKTGERLVDTITYAAGNAKIKFTYAPRPDLRVDFSGGTPVFDTQRLVDITTSTGTSATPPTYSRYRFTYEDQGSDGVIGALTDCDTHSVSTSSTPQQSLLRAIYRIGESGTPKRLVRCNTYFHGATTWSSGERVDGTVVRPVPAPLDPLTDTWTPMPVDFDGDGTTDLALLALRDGVATYHKVYMATPNRATPFVDSAGATTPSVLALQWETELNAKLGSIHFSNKYGHGVGDITGDGLPELLYENGGAVTIEHAQFGSWVTLTNSLDKCDLRNGQLADVDGDHRADIIVRAHAATGGCPARTETEWIKNLGDAPWFDSAQSQQLDVPLEAFTLPSLWTTALNQCGGVATPPTDYISTWTPESYVADQARFDDFNDDGIIDVAYALYGCWTTTNVAGLGLRWTPNLNSAYSRIFYGNGRNMFIDSGLSAGPPVLLDPLAFNTPGNTRLAPGMLGMADLDRDGHGELLQSTPSNGDGYGIGANACRSVSVGFGVSTTPAAMTYSLFNWHGSAYDCYRRTLQPAWGDFDGDGFLDKLTVQYNETGADGICPINTWCVVLARNERDISEGRLTATDNEDGGRTKLTWGFSAQQPNSNPNLPVNLEVVQSIAGPNGTRNLTYRNGTRFGDRASAFEEVSLVNDRGGMEVFSYITAPWAPGVQFLGVRYREDGSTEHVTRLVHGERYSFGFYYALARPYFNPLIRRCEFDVGFVPVNLDTLSDQCTAVNWLAPGVPQSSGLTEDHIAFNPDQTRLMIGHDRSPTNAQEMAAFKKVWGASTTSAPSYRAQPARLATNPATFQATFSDINTGVPLVTMAGFFRFPIPSLLLGKVPAIEQQEQAFSYPTFGFGAPDVFVTDFAYDNGVRKLVTQYQHRDLGTTADDRRIDYSWNWPDLKGYWYEKTAETMYTGAGVRLAQQVRSSFFKFDTPQTVSNCGVGAADCKADNYAYNTNGTLRLHTLPDATTESWTYLTWCGEPLTFIDSASRQTTYTRTANCQVESYMRNGVKITYTLDLLLRPIKTVLDPGGGTAATSTITRTHYYDDSYNFNATVQAREDADYSEPRRAIRRSDGQLELIYEDGLGRSTRVRQCQDRTANTTGGDISLVSCASGSDRNTAWNLYGTDGLLKVTTEPFANGESATTHGFGHDGQGREIISIEPAHAVGTSWHVTTILRGNGYDERTEPTTSGTRKVRFDHHTLSTSLTIDGASRGSETLDVLGNVIRSIAPDGKRTKRDYDTRHRLLKETLVDAFSNPVLEDCLDQNGASVNRSYVREITVRDARDRVKQEILPDGSTIDYTYDNADRVLTRKVNGILETTTTYSTPSTNVKGNVVVNDQVAGHTRTLSIDGLGRTWTRSGPRLNEKSVYDTTGNLATRTDDIAHLTSTYHYDLFDRLTSVEHPASGTTSYTYGGGQRPSTITDADGVVETLSYNYAGDLYREYRNNYLLRDLAYDPQGRVLTATEHGVPLAYEYDSLGRVTRRREGVNGASELKVTSYFYDAADRLIEARRMPVALNQQAITFIHYDSWGRPFEQIDPDNHATTTQFDFAGRVARVTDQELGVLDTRYDQWGRVIGRQRPGKAWEHFAYTANQMLVIDSIAEPGLLKVDAWDDEDAARGNLKTSTWIDGTGHRIQTNERDGTMKRWRWTEGRLTREETYDSSGSVYSAVDYTYDAAKRVDSMTRGPYTAAYDYTAAGRLSTLTTPDDAVVRTYDAGFLATETHGGITTRLLRGPTSPWIIGEERQVGSGTVRHAEIGRDLLGRVTRIEFTNGTPASLVRTFGVYDFYDHPWLETSTNGNANVLDAWIYDLQGRPLNRATSGTGLPLKTTEWTWKLNGAPSTVKTPSNRILSYEYGGGAFDYQLDRIKVDGVVVARVDARDARGSITQLRLPTANQTRTFRYDTMGRIDQRFSGGALFGPGLTWTATFHPDGRLWTEHVSDTAPVVPVAWDNTYLYDDAGRLVHEVAGRSGSTNDYILDEAGNRLETHDAAGAVVMTANYDGPKLLDVDGVALAYDAWNAVSSDHHGNNYVRSADGELAIIGGSGNGVSLIARDAHALPIAATEGTLIRRTTWNLDAAGMPLEVDEGDGDILTYISIEGHHLGTVTNSTLTTFDGEARNTPLRYGVQDLGFPTAFGEGVTSPMNSDERFMFAMLERAPSATEVLFARHRTYDPTTGRFLEPDPIGARGGVELYQYGGGDPVNFVDPLGLAAIGSDCTPGGGPTLHVDPIQPRTYDFESSGIPPSVTDQIASSGAGLAAYLRSLAGASSWITDILDQKPNIPGKGPLCFVDCAQGNEPREASSGVDGASEDYNVGADGKFYKKVTVIDFDETEVEGDPMPGTPSSPTSTPPDGKKHKEKGGKSGGGGGGGSKILNGIGEWLSDHFSGGPTGQSRSAIADAFVKQMDSYGMVRAALWQQMKVRKDSVVASLEKLDPVVVVANVLGGSPVAKGAHMMAATGNLLREYGENMAGFPQLVVDLHTVDTPEEAASVADRLLDTLITNTETAVTVGGAFTAVGALEEAAVSSTLIIEEEVAAAAVIPKTAVEQLIEAAPQNTATILKTAEKYGDDAFEAAGTFDDLPPSAQGKVFEVADASAKGDTLFANPNHPGTDSIAASGMKSQYRWTTSTGDRWGSAMRSKARHTLSKVGPGESVTLRIGVPKGNLAKISQQAIDDLRTYATGPNICTDILPGGQSPFAAVEVFEWAPGGL